MNAPKLTFTVVSAAALPGCPLCAEHSGPLAPPEEGAVGIIEAINSDRFEHYVPDMKAVVEMKTKDFDGFVVAMRSMGTPADEQSDQRTGVTEPHPGAGSRP